MRPYMTPHQSLLPKRIFKLKLDKRLWLVLILIYTCSHANRHLKLGTWVDQGTRSVTHKNQIGPHPQSRVMRLYTYSICPNILPYPPIFP